MEQNNDLQELQQLVREQAKRIEKLENEKKELEIDNKELENESEELTKEVEDLRLKMATSDHPTDHSGSLKNIVYIIRGNSSFKKSKRNIGERN
jgi:predicted RNase H-like nuclease (RuvC/YqgF family)